MSKHMQKRHQKERVILDDENRRLIKEREIDEEEECEHDSDDCCEGYDSKKNWKGYKSCVEFTYLSTCQCLKFIKKSISNCIGFFCFPIKERLCNCCDDIDKDLNPYKNPNYNPYDHL